MKNVLLGIYAAAAVFFAGIMIAAAPVCAEEDGEKKGGIFAEGGFFSEAVSSVGDKLDKVASGDEAIVDENAKGMDDNVLEYDRDPLGRSRAAQTNDDYRNYRKRMSREENGL